MKMKRNYVDRYLFLDLVRCQKCCKPADLKNETLKIMYFQIKGKTMMIKEKIEKIASRLNLELYIQMTYTRPYLALKT